MSTKVFVDTNILVYSRDASEPSKQQAASAWLAALWQSRCGKISHQILNEYYVTVTQKLKPGLPRETAREDIRNLMTWRPAVVEANVIESAWILQDRYAFSWWDSLIIAAAQKQDCDYLRSEDLQHEQKISKLRIINLRIINPFVSDVSLLTG